MVWDRCLRDPVGVCCCPMYVRFTWYNLIQLCANDCYQYHAVLSCNAGFFTVSVDHVFVIAICIIASADSDLTSLLACQYAASVEYSFASGWSFGWLLVRLCGIQFWMLFSDGFLIPWHAFG
jgi:hypothetical protein